MKLWKQESGEEQEEEADGSGGTDGQAAAPGAEAGDGKPRGGTLGQQVAEGLSEAAGEERVVQGYIPGGEEEECSGEALGCSARSVVPGAAAWGHCLIALLCRGWRRVRQARRSRRQVPRVRPLRHALLLQVLPGGGLVSSGLGRGAGAG